MDAVVIIRNVEVEGREVDVRIEDGVVVDLSPQLSHRAEEELDGDGAALLPGLHDHHLHLHSMAAARDSVDCSRGLAVLADAAGERVRGVRLQEPVDRHVLDRYESVRPVRVQHRSGALWVLNSAALVELGDLPHLPGVERDRSGRPTGRLWRLDELLRGTWPSGGDLSLVSAELASYGITGVTDATPGVTDAPVVRQRVTLLGQRKVMLHDHALPDFHDLAAQVGAIHDAGMPAAIHCVTREALLLTLAVLDTVGRLPGDRIEHGAIIPNPSALRGLTVVTQPGFLADRGEEYCRTVDHRDLQHLYPYNSLRGAGIAVVPSSDAPFGPADPWAVIEAAASRDLGPAERVPSAVALDGYLRDAEFRPRRVRVGMAADLVLLWAPLAEALKRPAASMVRCTWIGGRRAGPGTSDAGPACT